MPVTPKKLAAVEITAENLRSFLQLKVSPEQEAARLVGSVAVTIAQYHYEPGAWMRGLVAGDVPVGHIAMVDLEAPGANKEEGDPDDTAYLWRLLIDAGHQGKGYGAAALGIAFDQAARWGRSRVTLGAAIHKLSAREFYLRHGFQPTGRIVDEEEELMADVGASAANT